MNRERRFRWVVPLSGYVGRGGIGYSAEAPKGGEAGMVRFRKRMPGRRRDMYDYVQRA